MLGIGLTASEEVFRALDAGDFGKALALCDGLAQEYLPEHRALRSVVELLLPHNEQVFRREQADVSARIKAAVAAGEREEALRLIEEKRERQYRPIHDVLIDFKARSYDYVLRGYGEEQLYDCLRQVAEGQRRGFESWERMAIADFLRASAFIFALHLGKTTVAEDEDKYTLTLDPCGTGLKMVRTGRVEPEGEHARLATAQPMTFQRADLPAYCAHCAVWNEMACIEWFGHPQWVFDPWQKPGDACRWHLYKDPNRIPEEHWTTFGFRKPDRLPKPELGAAPSAEEMAGLGLTTSEKVRAALEAGELDRALALCDELPKEYVLMVKGLGLVAHLLLDYNEQVFCREQDLIAGRIRASIAAGDAAQARALIDQKRRQHAGLHDVYTAFMSATFVWIYTAFGDQAIGRCISDLAGEQKARQRHAGQM